MGLKPESDEAVAHLAAQAERAKKELEMLRHAERKVRKEVESVGELVKEDEWNEDNGRSGEELASTLRLPRDP
jgi:chaperonin cofactor prefoldin